MKVIKHGKVVDSKHLKTTDALLKLSKTKPFWEVADKVVETWTKREPERWKSFLVHLEAVKLSQKKTGGSWGTEWRGVSKDSGIERKHLVDFPIWIYLCLKKLYPNRDLNSKKFFRKFGNRFPIFKIFDKI